MPLSDQPIALAETLIPDGSLWSEAAARHKTSTKNVAALVLPDHEDPRSAAIILAALVSSSPFLLLSAMRS
jgi:hypothetical protein